MVILNSILTLLVQKMTSITFLGPLTLTPRQFGILFNILKKICRLDLMSSILLNFQVDSNRFYPSLLSVLLYLRIQGIHF